MYPLIDGVENVIRQNAYGTSILTMGAIMICRPRDFKQRKRFKKDAKHFSYDIILDYYLIKNVTAEQKRFIIRKQMIDITENTFSKYKFADFDKVAFLSDFNSALNAVTW